MQGWHNQSKRHSDAVHLGRMRSMRKLWKRGSLVRGLPIDLNVLYYSHGVQEDILKVLEKHNSVWRHGKHVLTSALPIAHITGYQNKVRFVQKEYGLPSKKLAEDFMKWRAFKGGILSEKGWTYD